MKSIRIIDALHIEETGVLAKTKNGRYQTVHLQQGDLDGACAVYSTMMILIMINAVKYNDISYGGTTYDGRSRIEKLKKELFEINGLHRDGNHFFHNQYDNIKDKLERSFGKEVSVVHLNSNEDETVADIQKQVLNNQPVLISYASKNGGAHALVAVGIESDGNDKPTKILCLDPSYSSPAFTYWNSVIDLKPYKGKYKYRNITESGKCHYVQLQDILIISKR